MHERFRFKTGEELIARGKDLGLDIPFSDDISPLIQPLSIDDFKLQNRFVVHPMEGYDSTPDGSPSPLTMRRYLRYAEGGSAIIWLEAVAVTRDGRSNPSQLWINEGNVEAFRKMVDEIRKRANEKGFNPFLVIQLTHSGRYSKPEGKPEPRVAGLNALLDKADPHLLSDKELESIRESYIRASALSADAGFDAIDIKACHGYLVIDSLSATGRVNSNYGGKEPGKRFRLMLETIDMVKEEVKGIKLTTRLNMSDCYQGGFATGEGNKPDYTEPLLLTGELAKRGISLINLSMGSPYHNPFVTRPFDTPVPGRNLPEENPLEGVMRMVNGTALFQEKFPGIKFVGSAYSWLRQYALNVGAATIKEGKASLIGFGRNSFAYPSMPADIISKGKADTGKFCITCSGCTRLISNLRHGGCVIRDREIYGEELKKLIADGK